MSEDQFTRILVFVVGVVGPVLGAGMLMSKGQTVGAFLLGAVAIYCFLNLPKD